MLLENVVLRRQHVVVSGAIVLVILQVDLKNGFGERDIDVLPRVFYLAVAVLTAKHVIIFSRRNQLFQNWGIDIGCCIIADGISARAIASNRLR